MYQILPNTTKATTKLKNRTTFLYFFKFKDANNDGATTRQQFAEHQATCLQWLVCEYAFIGVAENSWTHAAIFKFPNVETRNKAMQKGLHSDELEAVQGFAVQITTPPSFILSIFKLLRPFAGFWNRREAKVTAEEILKTMDGEGGIAPTKGQIIRHLQNNRTSKAYMINLLQSHPKAQYSNDKSMVSGATAYYRRYGLVALRSVLMMGGNLILAGRMGKPIIEINVPSLTKGAWEGIGIMEYPTPLGIFDLEKMPGYKKSLNHRRAGLERTVLIISKKNG